MRPPREMNAAGLAVLTAMTGARPKRPPKETESPSFLPGAGMMRTAVVFPFTMPIAASSAMMPLMTSAGVSPGMAIMSSPTLHTEVMASSLSSERKPFSQASIMPTSSHVGGLSGAFIPVSEDEGMIAAAKAGTLCVDKLEAMTCVCSVGLDMIAVPGDTSAETISAIIADEAAIGMVNNKTTAVRLLPTPGKNVGDTVEMGGLLGSAPVMPVHKESSADFIQRGGRIPAPLHSLRN